MPTVSSHSVDSTMPPGSRLLDRLAHEALITPDDYQKVFLHAQRVKGHCLDAVIEVGALTEGDLLKYLANIYKTRFVTTSKLAKVKIASDIVAKVPRKLAVRLSVCPILYDAGSHTLSVVAAGLGEDDTEKQVQMVSRARHIKIYVARPAAVAALIRKHYDRDPYAFSEISLSSPTHTQPAEQGGQGGYGSLDYYDDGVADSGLLNVATPKKGTGEHGLAPAAELARREIKIEAPDMTPGPPPPPPPQPRRPVSLAFQAVDLSADTSAVAEASEAVGLGEYLEMVNVLVALLEQGRGELRGHSAQVARMSRKLGERIGLTEKQMHGVLVAAYLHDVGKASTYHLTPLNVAQYEGHRIQAQKTYLSPLRMFESVKLPASSIETLTHLYERFDGRGFPDKLEGKELPLGARILAIAETYCDLTTHAKNPYRKVLDSREACDAIARYKSQFFDPNLVDLFQMVVLGDDLKAKLLSDRSKVLVVDPDPEETTVLELRLMERGYEVVIARSADDALARVAQGDVDVLITEVELAPGDGFELFQQLRNSEAGRELPVLFLTRRSDSSSVNKGFELGAADYLVKPASADVVAAKTRQVLDRRRSGTRGVSGSLSEMSLPDVVQILSNGRKSGVLKLQSGGAAGEIIFSDGAIWDARFGQLTAAEAFYAMLLLVDGSFSLDPAGRAGGRTINHSTESLLLEGMRRMDEGRQ